MSVRLLLTFGAVLLLLLLLVVVVISGQDGGRVEPDNRETAIGLEKLHGQPAVVQFETVNDDGQSKPDVCDRRSPDTQDDQRCLDVLVALHGLLWEDEQQAQRPVRVRRESAAAEERSEDDEERSAATFERLPALPLLSDGDSFDDHPLSDEEAVFSRNKPDVGQGRRDTGGGNGVTVGSVGDLGLTGDFATTVTWSSSSSAAPEAPVVEQSASESGRPSDDLDGQNSTSAVTSGSLISSLLSLIAKRLPTQISSEQLSALLANLSADHNETLQTNLTQLDLAENLLQKLLPILTTNQTSSSTNSASIEINTEIPPREFQTLTDSEEIAMTLQEEPDTNHTPTSYSPTVDPSTSTKSILLENNDQLFNVSSPKANILREKFLERIPFFLPKEQTIWWKAEHLRQQACSLLSSTAALRKKCCSTLREICPDSIIIDQSDAGGKEEMLINGKPATLENRFSNLLASKISNQQKPTNIEQRVFIAEAFDRLSGILSMMLHRSANVEE